MTRYKKTFQKLKEKKEKALISFVVVGDPNQKTSYEIIKKIIDSGTDILELGCNFSDPVADGKTIQAADVRAYNSGMNTDLFFDFIKKIRQYNDSTPIGILIYANLIYQRGIEKFYEDAKVAGIDSVLVADLPIEEADDYIKAAKENNVDTVFIVTELTGDERLRLILKKTKGFVYVISRLGVTGERKELGKNTIPLIKKLKSKTTLPLCIGFGISSREHVKQICNAGADGAIVGSAIVKIIGENLNNKELMLNKIADFVRQLKKETL